MNGGDEAENLVRLTPEEHFVAHQLLVKMYPSNRDLVFAICAMRMNGRTKGKSNNKQFGWLRRRMSEAISDLKRGIPRPPHVGEAVRRCHLGTKHSAEVKAKRSLALKGKAKSPEHVEQMRARMVGTVGTRVGHTNSPEHRAKQSAAAMVRRHPNNKLTPETAHEIKRLIVEGETTLTEIGRLHGVAVQTVCNIKHGRKWAHVVV